MKLPNTQQSVNILIQVLNFTDITESETWFKFWNGTKLLAIIYEGNKISIKASNLSSAEYSALLRIV